MSFKNLFISALTILMIASCKKKTVETDNIFKYRDYISYTTSGMTSVAKPIQINLAKVVDGWEMHQEINNNLISIKPHVDGKLEVGNNHTLIFTPDESLEPSTEYTVTVKLSKIYANIPDNFKDYTFQFKTITPNFNIVTNNLQSYSKNWQYLEGVIKSADLISLENAKQLISAEQNGENLKIVFNEGDQSSNAFEF